MFNAGGSVDASDTSEYGETRVPSKKLVSCPLITYSLWLIFNNFSDGRQGIEWDIDIESDNRKGYPPQRHAPRYWRRICQAKVLILDDIPSQLRDEIKFTIDTHRVRLIHNNNKFDKPSFVLSCLASVNVDLEVLVFWEGLKGADIWEIKRAVDRYKSGHANSAFEVGPAFQERLVAPRELLGGKGSVMKAMEVESHSIPPVSSDGLGAEVEADMDSDTTMIMETGY